MLSFSDKCSGSVPDPFRGSFFFFDNMFFLTQLVWLLFPRSGCFFAAVHSSLFLPINCSAPEKVSEAGPVQ
jgi:hypothetical protein